MSPKAVLVAEHDMGVAQGQRALKTDSPQDTNVARELKTGPALRLEIETAPSPQDTLPNDVLVHIFVLISQDHGPVVFPNLNHEALPQIVLSHVCPRWRTLTLSTFELWNNVCLVDRDDSLLYHEWLSRAGSSPIELSLRFASSSRDDAARIIQDTVSHFKLPIKMLHIELTFRQFKALSSFPNTILPHIKKLELEFNSSDVEAFSSTPISFTSCRLRSVVLFERHSFTYLDSDALLNISLPWSELRCLALHSPAILIPVFNILRQIPLLQELHLCIYSKPSDLFAPLERLTIPSMRRIVLQFYTDAIETNKVLRNITCSALVELDIRVPSYYGWSKETYEIIKRQYNLQGLKGLSLFNPIITPSSILQDAPKLQKLRITGDTMDYYAIMNDIDETIAGLSNGTLGLHLRELTTDYPCNVDHLLDMLEMRKRTVDMLIENGCNWTEVITILRKVEVYSCYGKYTSGYKEKVDALKEVGIIVTLPKAYLKPRCNPKNNIL